MRNNADFTLSLEKSVRKGLENLSYLGPNIWEILPVEITDSLLELKAKIKTWNPRCCPCPLYKYISSMQDSFRSIDSMKMLNLL